MDYREVASLLSEGHFSVDGTLVKASALKSPAQGGRHAPRRRSGQLAGTGQPNKGPTQDDRDRPDAPPEPPFPQCRVRFLGRGELECHPSLALLRQFVPVLGNTFAPTAPDDAGDLFVWAEGMAPMRNGAVLPAIGPRLAPYQPFADTLWPPVPAKSRARDASTIVIKYQFLPPLAG